MDNLEDLAHAYASGGAARSAAIVIRDSELSRLDVARSIVLESFRAGYAAGLVAERAATPTEPGTPTVRYAAFDPHTGACTFCGGFRSVHPVEIERGGANYVCRVNPLVEGYVTGPLRMLTNDEKAAHLAEMGRVRINATREPHPGVPASLYMPKEGGK